MSENIALAAAQSAAASASSAATSAEHAASIIAEPNDAAVSTLVNTPASSTAAALSATIARSQDGLGFVFTDTTETAATTSDVYGIGSIDGIGYGHKEAGTNPGLYSTTDGSIWSYVGAQGGYGIHALGNGEVILNAGQTLKRSTGWAANPATATWTTVATANGTSSFIRSDVDTYDNIVIAAEYAVPRTDARFVKVSTDYGQTFTNALDLDVIEPGQAASTHWHAVCVDPFHSGANPRLWASHGDAPVNGVYYSDNLGATWTLYDGNWQPMPLAATPNGIVTMTDAADPDGVWLIPRDLGPRQMLAKIERPYWLAALVGFGVAAHRDEATGIVYMLFRIDQQTYFTEPIGAMIYATDGTRADLIYTTDAKGTVGVAGTVDFISRPTLVAGKLLNTYTDTAGVRHAVVGTVGRGVPIETPNPSLTSIAIGAGAEADRQSVAIGAGAGRTADTDSETVAIGEEAVAGNQAVSVGAAADSGEFGVSVGRGATGGSEATAVGSGAGATPTGAVALGRQASAGGANSIAAGRSASTTHQGQIAVGYNAAASTSNDGVAIGTFATASGNSVVAVGYDADATAAQATALGQSTRATGAFAVAVGSGATAAAEGNVAIGKNATVSASNLHSVALGESATATDWWQVAFGPRSMELIEVASTPAAGAANTARLYARDNGAGKTQLVVQFPTGAVVVLATEA